jgi:5-methylthioribose kinase
LLPLDSHDALDWIAGELRVPAGDVRLTALGGGISNLVILAEAPGIRYVFKQALERLRVEQEWLCRRDRIFRESAAIRDLAAVLPPGSVPELVLESRDNYLYAMRAAPADAVPWKSQLLAGEVRLDTAARAGHLLGTWIRESANQPDWPCAYGDWTVFEELRLDPYYRTTAENHPELSDEFASLIDECRQRRISLVHGDFSPKNLLALPDSLTVIDWEVVHWGDPSFDAAFLTNHLLLKAFYRPGDRLRYRDAALVFWRALHHELGSGFDWLEPAAMRHLGCLLLARIDGKSPAEYIRQDEAKDQIRRAAIGLIRRPTHTAQQCFDRLFS